MTSGRAKPCVIEQPKVCSVVMKLFKSAEGQRQNFTPQSGSGKNFS
jgi:hypothetical protein